jgi:two-component system chemotaxis response regulator CheY
MAKILIADDDAHIVRVLSMWLQRHGHEVVTSRDGEAALETLDRETVDMIISDMNMPGLDGIGLAKAVRAKGGGAIPILVLTARCDQERLNEQLATYGVRVYPKPFQPSQLVVEINRLLGVATSEGSVP